MTIISPAYHHRTQRRNLWYAVWIDLDTVAVASRASLEFSFKHEINPDATEIIKNAENLDQQYLHTRSNTVFSKALWVIVLPRERTVAPERGFDVTIMSGINRHPWLFHHIPVQWYNSCLIRGLRVRACITCIFDITRWLQSGQVYEWLRSLSGCHLRQICISVRRLRHNRSNPIFKRQIMKLKLSTRNQAKTPFTMHHIK